MKEKIWDILVYGVEVIELCITLKLVLLKLFHTDTIKSEH